MNREYGEVDIDNTRATVAFDRVFDTAMATVWDMLTTDEGLERWLAPATVDLRTGGTVDLDFGEEGLAGGAIIDLVSGSSIEYEWRFPGEPDSIIRFDLEALDDGRTRLRLNHRLLPPDQAVGYGAGWHAHLDQLADALGGGTDFDWMGRFNGLLSEYRTLVVV
ncbi:MAG: SRPBCC domain-containing protein [Acidimicrobiia bacterium]|nr:SRPBCC domain-containing protein [Acidimicrobiia bacterium]